VAPAGSPLGIAVPPSILLRADDQRMIRRSSLQGGAATWPVVARAQQGARIRRVGVLMGSALTQAEQQSYLAAFLQGLRQLGRTEGQNLRMDVRWNAVDARLARTYAEQLIGLMPSVSLATSTVNLMAIQQATSTVLVVLASVADPSRKGSLPAYDTRVPTLPVSDISNSRSAANGLVCPRKLRPPLGGSP
jgi:hypothetical protein